MKKILLGTLLIIITFTMMACDSNDSNKNNSNNNSTKTTNNSSTNASNTVDNDNENNDNTENITLDLKYNDEEILSLPETPASSFDYKEVEGGVMITFYEGKESIVVIPSQIDGKDVVSIGKESFSYTDIEIIVTGKKVTIIEPKAFYGSRVKKVIINGAVTEIGSHAFYLSHIEEIDLPDSLTVIKDNAFLGSKLKIIKIPENVKTIGQTAFFMSALEEVVIDNGVEKIESNAFGNCKSLKKIHIPSSVTVVDGALYNSEQTTVITPTGSVAEEYAKANNIPVEHP